MDSSSLRSCTFYLIGRHDCRKDHAVRFILQLGHYGSIRQLDFLDLDVVLYMFMLYCWNAHLFNLINALQM